MNPSPDCLAAEQVQSLLECELSPLDLAATEEHLSHCVRCRHKLELAIGSPDWWREAQESLGEMRETAPAWDDGPTESSHADVLSLLGPTDDPRMMGRVGTYEIVGILGRGGMGVVFKGFDGALNRFVAIKMLAPHLATSGAARKRFEREAQAAAAVVHDHVMAIHSVAEWQGVPYFVMPYVRGSTLQKRLDQQGPLELLEILRIGTQTASGLAAAHAQGLVHRDVKPANILLADGVERVTLMDFGLARAVDDSSLTRTGVLAGTPQYMSPEQAQGKPVDFRSDLFSLGSVLYALCTGSAPFRAETSYGVLRLITDDEPRKIVELNPRIPDWFGLIVAKLMHKRPDDRFASAREVAELLESCLAHVQQPSFVPLPSVVRRAHSRRGIHRVSIVLLILAMCLLPLGMFIQTFVATSRDQAGEMLSANEFYQDFRRDVLPQAPWTWHGRGKDTQVEASKSGLTISLLKNRSSREPVGPSLEMPVRGDFEGTVSYKISSEEIRTEKGNTVGVQFHVETLSHHREEVTFSRLVTADGRDIYTGEHREMVEGEVRERRSPPLVAGARSGRLRMIRNGSEVILLSVEEDKDEFVEMTRFPIGTEDVRCVRIAAFSDGPEPVRIVLEDFRIRSPQPLAEFAKSFRGPHLSNATPVVIDASPSVATADWFRPDPFPQLGAVSVLGFDQSFVELAAMSFNPNVMESAFSGAIPNSPESRVLREKLHEIRKSTYTQYQELTTSKTVEGVPLDRERIDDDSVKLWKHGRDRVEAILSSSQTKRLTELVWQRWGYAAFMAADLREKLGITATQQTDIQKAIRDHSARIHELDKELAIQQAKLAVEAGGSKEKDLELRRDKNRRGVESHQTCWADIYRILTPAQRERYETLRGAPVPKEKGQDAARAHQQNNRFPSGEDVLPAPRSGQLSLDKANNQRSQEDGRVRGQPGELARTTVGVIEGQLTDQITGKPVSEALIACGAVINEKNGGGANALTDMNGKYRLEGLSPGIYNVWIKSFKNDPRVTAMADEGLVVEAGKVVQSALTLRIGNRVTGLLLDQKSEPVRDASIGCYSAARPNSSSAVQSTKTNQNGQFEFYLPPGRAQIYVMSKLFVGDNLTDSRQLIVPETGEISPLTLVLRPGDGLFGAADWLQRSTPGTEIVGRNGNQGVTGIVVDLTGKPIPNARVFKEDGPIVRTNDKGEFLIEINKGTQFVMYSQADGCRVWFGTPTSGDVLKIVMEPKK